ncbi:phage lytic cycle repressor MrpR family protein [Bacillus sp. T33-2]|uniref:phage lytic cycle repressor MrpR family protein n=1 Tax=Bacillus sp. T33-2 TaxID=2054168 RepID=UPI000C773AFF|nr:hypothetical protein [Bacillus sp. T33-2]PLR99549.1 hypothetical protein CVD19_00365 [Bacillus sp. T33-2]
MSRLYNEEIKEKFLSENYENEQTRKTIRNVFYKSEPIENVLDKDLYNFNLDEIGNVIKNSNPLSASVARSTGRFLTQYITWAAPYRKSNLNPVKGVTNEWYDQFSDKTKKIHFSEDELFNGVIEQLENAQDQALIALIFEGIIGKGFSELKPLHYNHINWNTNEITVPERDGEKVQVSDRVMRYVEQAYKQRTYSTFNEETQNYNERELLQSDYIFKNIKSPRAKNGEVNGSVFYTRMNNIREAFDLEYLTPNSIRQSGMIKMSADLLKEKIEEGKEPKLEYEDFEKIGDKYKFSKVYNKGYSYYNTTLLREFVNPSTLKELYNIDAEV